MLPQPVASLHVLMFPDFTMIIIFTMAWSSAIPPYLFLLMMRLWMVSILDSSKCNEVIVSQSPCSFWFDVIIKDCCPHAAYFSCLDTEEYSVVFTCNFFIIKKVVHLLMTNFLITCLWKQFITSAVSMTRTFAIRAPHIVEMSRTFAIFKDYWINVIFYRHKNFLKLLLIWQSCHPALAAELCH